MYDEVLGKNVIIDDYDEFHSDRQSDDEEDQQEEQGSDYKYNESKDNNSVCINEDLDDNQEEQVFENISVFEHDDADENNIPFNIDDDQQSYNEHTYQEEEQEVEKEKETLKQMRMVFGSEQKIREQSEAAIQQLTHQTNNSYDSHDCDHDEFQTPGLSQSVTEHRQGTSNTNMFAKNSFQEFSMKKFQELMFENHINDIADSVERSVRENTGEYHPIRSVKDVLHGDKSMTPKRGSFVSPRKVSRKELELDRIAGTKMKYMSEKKKQRNSILDQHDSSLLKTNPQNPMNRSVDGFQSNFFNSKTNEKKLDSAKVCANISSEINLMLNPPFKALSKSCVLSSDWE